MMKNTLLVAMLGFTLQGCASSPEANSLRQALTFTKHAAPPQIHTISHGHDNSVNVPMTEIFRERADLHQWASGKAHLATSILSATADVDFRHHSLLLVSPGPQAHRGYALSLADDAMLYGSGSASIRLMLTVPAANLIFADGVTAPFLLLRIPARPYQQIAIDYAVSGLQQTAYYRN